MEDSVREDIIRMAREAGFDFNSLGVTFTSGYLDDHLERFAALVAAAEREAAIEDARTVGGEAGAEIEKLIRARGQG